MGCRHLVCSKRSAESAAAVFEGAKMVKNKFKKKSKLV